MFGWPFTMRVSICISVLNWPDTCFSSVVCWILKGIITFTINLCARKNPIHCSLLDLGMQESPLRLLLWHSDTKLTLSVSILAAFIPCFRHFRVNFSKAKATLEFFFLSSRILKLEFQVLEMESPMIDRLEYCFSAVYPLPCVQESKSWQPLSDPWMRTSEHIDNWALCSSSHLLQAVVYMLMPNSRSRTTVSLPVLLLAVHSKL